MKNRSRKGCLGDLLGDEMLFCYCGDFALKHCKDPVFQTTRIQWKIYKSFFFRGSYGDNIYLNHYEDPACSEPIQDFMDMVIKHVILTAQMGCFTLRIRSRPIGWAIHNWVAVSNIFCFHPYLGKIPKLTNIFQIG